MSGASSSFVLSSFAPSSSWSWTFVCVGSERFKHMSGTFATSATQLRSVPHCPQQPTQERHVTTDLALWHPSLQRVTHDRFSKRKEPYHEIPPLSGPSVHGACNTYPSAILIRLFQVNGRRTAHNIKETQIQPTSI